MRAATVASVEDLVAPVAGLALSDVPAAAVDAAEDVVTETIAVAVAGARESGHGALVARLSEPADREHPANVIAAAPRWAPPTQAAFLNGTAAIALELDEFLVGGGHPASHVVPAALAVAQHERRSGEELIAAVLAGYEVSGRLFRGYRIRYPGHPHGAIGAIGAATAAALLLDADPLAAAGIAAGMPMLPTWSACFEGADSRNAWTGAAAMIGVLAAELALTGHAAGAAALDFLELHAERLAGADLVVELDQPMVLASASRSYAVAGPLQTAVQIARELRGEIGAEVRAVTVETFEANLKFAALPRPADLSARFSLPYAVAAGLTATAPDPAAFGYDEGLLPVAELVQVVVAEDLQSAWPEVQGARITVDMRDGEDRAGRCDFAPGHPRRPLSSREREERRAALLGARSDLAPALSALRRQGDVSRLLDGGER